MADCTVLTGVLLLCDVGGFRPAVCMDRPSDAEQFGNDSRGDPALDPRLARSVPVRTGV